jgi:hypothetical protein
MTLSSIKRSNKLIERKEYMKKKGVRDKEKRRAQH